MECEHSDCKSSRKRNSFKKKRMHKMHTQQQSQPRHLIYLDEKNLQKPAGFLVPSTGRIQRALRSVDQCYVQQLNSLNPQKIITPPRTMSHSLEGRIKAQIVQIPIISRTSPNNSTSPGCLMQNFLKLKNFITFTLTQSMS